MIYNRPESWMKKKATITITGSGRYNTMLLSKITIDGIMYTGPAVVSVPMGTIMSCSTVGTVYLDGVSLGTTADIEITGNCKVYLLAATPPNQKSSKVEITTV